MASRSRSQNSSLALVSTMKHYSAQAKRRLTGTTPTPEPGGIAQCKSILKSTKNLTSDIEQIANSLYLAQTEKSQILCTLSNKLSNIAIKDSSDRFGIFANNIGRVYQNMQGIYEMHLVNMKDELINPLHEFNTNEIEQCQMNKLHLKTIKAQYDVKKQNEDKITKLINERFPSDELTANTNTNKTRSKSMISSNLSIIDLKSDELEQARSEFINNVMVMMAKRMQLMQSMKHFMCSFEAYSTMLSKSIENEEKIMSDCNVSKTHNNWSKNEVVLKEGYFKCKKQGNRKYYFKLFKNKKLIYMTGNGANGIIKGYVDLNKIFDIIQKNEDLIQIQTITKMYLFQFDSMNERDEWFKIMQKTVASKKISIIQTKKSFEQNYMQQ